MAVWALGEWATPLSPRLVGQLGAMVHENGAGGRYNTVVRRNLTWAIMKLKTKSKAAESKSKAAEKTKKEGAKRASSRGFAAAQ
jgi:hypothetical protein